MKLNIDRINSDLINSDLINSISITGLAAMAGVSLLSLPVTTAIGASCMLAGVVMYLKKKDIEDLLNEAFINKGLYSSNGKNIITPKLVNKEEWENGFKLSYRLPPGFSEEDIWKIHRGLEVTLDSEIEVYESKGLIHLHVYTHELPEEVDFKYPDYTIGTLPVAIGESRSGIELLDIGKAPHTLIAGETGGGKTNLFRVIAAGLLARNDVELYAIDVTRKLSYLRSHVRFASDYGAISNMVYNLSKIMNERYSEFDKLGIDDIDSAPKGKFKRIVIMIDEFNGLSPSLARGDKALKEERTTILGRVSELVTRGRGCGIHCIAGIQRPDAKIMEDGQLKANMPVRIAFKTFDESNSRIILDKTLAAFIPGDIPGRSVIRGKDRVRQIQIYNLPHHVAKSILPKGKELPEEKIPEEVNPLAFLLNPI